MPIGSSEKVLATERPEVHGPRLPYLPGLDGLRALAVIGVLLYHAEQNWFPGGFLGVEVFFVISGYLITSLLLAEWHQWGRIDLKRFWLRRARRLLPALYLLLAGVLAFALILLPNEVSELRGAAAAALGYVTNWYLVLHHESYFEAVGRPPLLQHLWSLAVEEQFYLIWPLLFIVGMRRLHPRHMLLAVLAGAAASTALMALLYQPNADPSRLYYGTDTRAAELLVGAALAFVWAPGQLQGRVARANALLLDVIGLTALGVVVWSYLGINEFQPFLYLGGFALIALVTAVLIAMTVHPRAHLGGLLGWEPLRWMGLRSYGIYLWHWPVFMVTRPQLDVAIDGLPLLVLRLAVTFVLAELSYRYVETPIRSGALGRAWNTWRESRGVRRRWLGVRWAGAAGAVMAFSMVLGVAVAEARPPTPPAYLSVQSINTIGSPGTSTTTTAANPAPSTTPPPIPTCVHTAPKPASPTTHASASPTTQASPAPTMQVPAPPPTASPASSVPQSAPPPTSPAPSPPSGAAPTGSQPAPTPTPAPTNTPEPPVRVTAIGDSVMLGAASELEQDIPGIQIDAAVDRQVSAAINILRADRAAGKLGTVVVIHLGNNGTFTTTQFDEIMQILTGAKRVVFVNLKVPRPWEGLNNAVLAAGVKRYPNAVLVDWQAESANHPEYFWGDGIHLRPGGAKVYAGLIAANVKGP